MLPNLKIEQFFFELFRTASQFIEKTQLAYSIRCHIPRLVIQLFDHQLMAGIKQHFYPLDKAFQPRFIFRLAYLIELLAQFQLFHQERGIAHGMLLAGEIETVK